MEKVTNVKTCPRFLSMFVLKQDIRNSKRNHTISVHLFQLWQQIANTFMGNFSEFGYIGLFISSFLAATILPLSSEVVLSALLVSGLSPFALVIVATTGNVSGSLTNYALGYWSSMGVIKKWLKMSEKEFVQAGQRFKKYGMFSLCFAWVPIIGDPLTVMAGILRIRIFWFFLLVTAGKLARYIVISYLALQVW